MKSIQRELTVIIPVYNGMPFLPRAVESILEQSFREYKLLIVDDGSRDGSLDYLRTLDDPRIEIRCQPNMGLCQSLNLAIESAESRFIARLDQDDIAMPHRLEKQLSFLGSNPNYAGVLSNYSRISADGNEFGYYQTDNVEKIYDYRSELHGCILNSTFMFDRLKFKELGGYRASLYPVDDYDLLMRFEEKHDLAVINEPLVKYRIHSGAWTFKTFYDMETKSRYAKAIADRRRLGKSEISLRQFRSTVDRLSPWGELIRYAHSTGKLLFRKSGLLIGEKKKISGLLNLSFALCLAPGFAIRRLMSLRSLQ